MKVHKNRALLGRLAAAGITMATLIGCGSTKGSAGVTPVDSASPPVMPMPMPGQASVSGVVRDAAGVVIAGATVKVAETDTVTTTDSAGAFALMVPADSTVTIGTFAAGFATSYRESVVLADQAAVKGFDLFLLSTEQVGRMNLLGGRDAAVPQGLMAIRLHSLSDSCVLPGATLSVFPSKAASVVYSRPMETGIVDEPDPTMASVQAGVTVDAWLTAALPPGNMLQIAVEQPGCTVLSPSPSMGGVQFPGLRRIDAQTLTIADLYLN